MKRTTRGRLRARIALVAIALMGATMLVASPAGAAVLTNPSWSVSNSQVSATGVTYTFQFTTATAGTVGSVAMTVPAGTAGTPAIASNYGVGAGSIALASNTLTYTVTSPASIAAGTPILISVSGLTNTSTAGDYTSTITTKDNASPTPATIDSATTAAVTFGANNTAVTAVVAKSLTFTNNTSSFTWLLDPSLAALSDLTKDVTLTVKTNAGAGYTVAVKNSGLVSGTYSIPAVSTGVATGVATASFGANKYGYKVAVTAGGSSGAAAQSALATSGNYVGYTTGAGETAVSASGPTGNTADSIVITNRVKIDYTTKAGTYADTITYIVTPSY